LNTSRRAIIAGAAAAAFSGAADAQLFRRNRNTTVAPASGPYGAAAAYSAERRGVSLLVMKNGEILFEDYPGDGGVSKGWELASGTKSFTGIMAAMAATDGLLDIDEPVAKTITQWNDAARQLVTIRHLLTLTSGLSGEGAVARPPDYLEAIKARAEKSPGAMFRYGPTDFQIFGEVLKRKLRAAGRSSDPADYIQSRVFDAIGVRPTSWKRGDDGNPYMPQGAQLTARDWAKFGHWVMDGAKGADRKTFAALFEPTAANPGYGLSWWLLRPGLIGPGRAAGIDSDAIGAVAKNEDIVMAAGAGDQRLYLLRKRGLVVARQANQIARAMLPRSVKWRDDEFLNLLLSV
jgi:CubicO group peptidase (beta-lactamase class C family)